MCPSCPRWPHGARGSRACSGPRSRPPTAARAGRTVPMSRDVESVVERVAVASSARCRGQRSVCPARLIALKLLESGERSSGALAEDDPGLLDELGRLRGRARGVAWSPAGRGDLLRATCSLDEHLRARGPGPGTQRRVGARTASTATSCTPSGATSRSRPCCWVSSISVFGLGRVVETPLVALFGRLDGWLEGPPAAGLALAHRSSAAFSRGSPAGSPSCCPTSSPFSPAWRSSRIWATCRGWPS